MHTINALFYDDKAIHKIYKNKGSFDIEYQIPKIIYSSLISLVINALLKLLALSNDAILDFKQNKSKEDVNQRELDLKNKLKIKFILYFILSLIFLIFFWYYTSIFGAIYKNTQYHLVKDILISFGISLITPFGIYLLPGIFRIASLAEPKKGKVYLYQFSKLLQNL